MVDVEPFAMASSTVGATARETPASESIKANADDRPRSTICHRTPKAQKPLIASSWAGIRPRKIKACTNRLQEPFPCRGPLLGRVVDPSAPPVSTRGSGALTIATPLAPASSEDATCETYLPPLASSQVARTLALAIRSPWSTQIEGPPSV